MLKIIIFVFFNIGLLAAQTLDNFIIVNCTDVDIKKGVIYINYKNTQSIVMNKIEKVGIIEVNSNLPNSVESIEFINDDATKKFLRTNQIHLPINWTFENQSLEAKFIQRGTGQIIGVSICKVGEESRRPNAFLLMNLSDVEVDAGYELLYIDKTDIYENKLKPHWISLVYINTERKPQSPNEIHVGRQIYTYTPSCNAECNVWDRAFYYSFSQYDTQQMLIGVEISNVEPPERESN